MIQIGGGAGIKPVKLVLIAVAVLWISAVAFAFFWHFGPSDNALGLPTDGGAEVGGHSAGSIGSDRYALLVEATRKYRESGAAMTPEMEDGTAFAPVPFINEELRSRGEKWRVRSIDGTTATIYEIS